MKFMAVFDKEAYIDKDLAIVDREGNLVWTDSRNIKRDFKLLKSLIKGNTITLTYIDNCNTEVTPDNIALLFSEIYRLPPSNFEVVGEFYDIKGLLKIVDKMNIVREL